MQNPFEQPLKKLETIIQALRPQLIDALGIEGLKFIDDNFRMQGYQGRNFIPWAPRKDNKRPGGAILVQTGALRRSFRQTNNPDSVTISTDIPYARTHNEGNKGQYGRSRMGTFGKPVRLNTPQRQFLPITNDDSPILLQKCAAVLIRKITEALPK